MRLVWHVASVRPCTPQLRCCLTGKQPAHGQEVASAHLCSGCAGLWLPEFW